MQCQWQVVQQCQMQRMMVPVAEAVNAVPLTDAVVSKDAAVSDASHIFDLVAQLQLCQQHQIW